MSTAAKQHLARLHVGAEVFWNDPNDGVDAGYYRVVAECRDEVSFVIANAQGRKYAAGADLVLADRGLVVLRSQSEYGYWSNALGWVYDVNSATHYEAPVAGGDLVCGPDAHWVPVANAEDFDPDEDPLLA